jgi:hypothetical protein
MKLTLKQIVESQEALQHLMDQRLPAKTAYRLQRDLRKVLEEIETFKKVQDAKVHEYGIEVPEAPGQFQIPPEKISEYMKDIGDLINQEIELDLHPVDLEDLKDVDMTLRDVLLLSYLIKEE